MWDTGVTLQFLSSFLSLHPSPCSSSLIPATYFFFYTFLNPCALSCSFDRLESESKRSLYYFMKVWGFLVVPEIFCVRQSLLTREKVPWDRSHVFKIEHTCVIQIWGLPLKSIDCMHFYFWIWSENILFNFEIHHVVGTSQGFVLFLKHTHTHYFLLYYKTRVGLVSIPKSYTKRRGIQYSMCP